MSGIVGIFDRNGAPADRRLLLSLVHSLSFCGLDGRDVWFDGAAGLGHALLRTTRESLGEREIPSLDGKLWITADARIDSRRELATELEQAGQKVRKPATDPELILHAYAAWDEECVQHLRGDFAFAIWDARRKTLFCARDHFGVKPFYYAEAGGRFLFSNVLNCLRAHPDVPQELNEAAIADFLLFGLNLDTSSTSFQAIRRLPPAHTLSVTSAGIKIARYWSAPVDGRIRYRHSHEYIEHFQILLQEAVADRLRSDRVGILLSDGLDSASVAAMAKEISSTARGAADLRAYTVTYDSPGANTDGAYARLSAEFLRIPIRCLPMDHLHPFDRWDNPEIGPPEPSADPFFAGLHDQFRALATDTRVALSGEGADNLMHFEMRPYLRELWRNREWKRLIADVPGYLQSRPSLLRAGFRKMKRAAGDRSNSTALPRWISPDLAKRQGLESRWKEWTQLPGPLLHPLLPKGHASLTLPQWSHMFENSSPGVTHSPVEVRYPFLDLRVVYFLLALPPYPWFFEKMLLREAMIGRLPEDVRVRPKKAFENDPLAAQLHKPGAPGVDPAGWSSEIEAYVRRSALPTSSEDSRSLAANANFRPACLNFWLQTSRRLRYNMQAEARNA